MRILLDTNVVLDFILLRKDHLAEASTIFKLLDDDKIRVFVAAISVTNVFYITKKELYLQKAHDAVHFSLDSVEFCEADKHILEDAYALGFTDFEDAVQCASAKAEGLDAIVTRNKKDFVNSPIPVYSPTEFLALIGASDKP